MQNLAVNVIVEVQSALEAISKYKNKKYAAVDGALIIELKGFQYYIPY